MQLIPVPSTHIDFAWRDGADSLARACNASGGEITGDQLKMMLARGERTLLQLKDGELIAGWGVVRVDQLPNKRVLFITDLVAPNVDFPRFLEPLKEMAKTLGCSAIRCAAKEAQERLYRMKTDFKPVYSILEVSL